jgi:predicted enzyme related to lactoylglutathione lyase
MLMVTATKVRPAWVELATDDPAASREFYSKLFGWNVEVSEDPQYGGYAMARLGGAEGDVAGITAKMMPEAPTAWSLYLETDDAAALGEAVQTAGGTVIAPAFDVGDQGRMAVFSDPTGAVISAWQAGRMRTFRRGDVGSFGWAELNARGIDKAIEFYGSVFGWTAETTPMGEGQPDYTTFAADGEPVAGAMEMQPSIPPEVPSYWMIYFNVADVDDAFNRAVSLGANEMVAPSPMPGGRFAIISDPQGAMVGLLKLDPTEG